MSIHYALIIYYGRRFYSYVDGTRGANDLAAELGITVVSIRTGLNSMADVLYQHKEEIGFDPRILAIKGNLSMRHWP